jgi:hypothetical protein
VTDRISINFEDARARRKLERLTLFVSDLRPFWPLVVPLFIEWMREQFESEGAFAGNPWAPLAPAYEAYKAVKYPGKPILQATGALRRAASNPSRRVAPTSLTLTIHSDYLGYHQEGTSRMPARPLVFENLPMIARAQLAGVAERYVREIVARA